jgi:hypothetical protein
MGLYLLVSKYVAMNCNESEPEMHFTKIGLASCCFPTLPMIT